MKKQITITIDGPQGAGKTMLASHLVIYLQSTHGVKCVLNDDHAKQKPNASYAALREYFDAEVTFNVVQK